MIRGFLLFAVIFFTARIFAHTRMKAATTLIPRSTSDSIKTGPCGGLPRSANPVQLTGGQTITVNWEETINHPGRYEFYFSNANDSNWMMLKTVNDDQNNTNDLPHQFSTTLTMPNVTCTGCTIQLIQVMTENPANPSLYYSCSDITLQSNTTMPPTTVPAGPDCD